MKLRSYILPTHRTESDSGSRPLARVCLPSLSLSLYLPLSFCRCVCVCVCVCVCMHVCVLLHVPRMQSGRTMRSSCRNGNPSTSVILLNYDTQVKETRNTPLPLCFTETVPLFFCLLPPPPHTHTLLLTCSLELTEYHFSI